jgi:hypothetical protein
MLNQADDPGIPGATNSPPQTNSAPPQLLGSGSVPTKGTFWFLAETNWPPMPFDPCAGCDVYALSDGSYLVDDTSFSWPPPSSGGGVTPQGGPQPSYSPDDLWLEITGVTNSTAYLTLHGTTSGTLYTILSKQSLSSPDQWDAEQPLIGAEGQDWTQTKIPTFGRPVLFFRALVGSAKPHRLWLYVPSISQNSFNCVLWGTSEDTSYDIRSVTSLHATNNWAVETNFLGASGQFWTPVSIPMSGRPSLFVSARSWVDSTGSGIPDWWEQLYFVTNGVDPYALCPCGDGWTILQAFQNGWNPSDWHMPPAPTGLAVKYYGPSTNLCVQWNPSPGPVTNYVVRRYLPSPDQTNDFVSGQNVFWTSPPSGGIYPGWPPTYQVMAQYPGGPSAWSDPVSIYNPAISLEVTSGGGKLYLPYTIETDYIPSTTANASVVRGPLGHLFLVTGYVPPSIASVRISVTPDTYRAPSYPWAYEANYLWEDLQPFTNAPSGGSFEVSAALLQSGFYELPASLAAPYGLYDVNVEAVATDGTVSDCRPIVGYAQDAWTLETGAIPFLDGRRQIKENAEFQLRAAQGCATRGSNYTNQVPFGIEQYRPGINWPFPLYYSESAQVDYVAAGFHYFRDASNDLDLPGAALTLDAFRPFEQNCFYANFLSGGPPWLALGPTWDAQGDSRTTLGIPFWGDEYGVFEVDQPWTQFSVSAFVQSGTTNPISSLLSPAAAQWLFLDDGSLSIYDTFSAAWRTDGAVHDDFPNLYGLNLLSVQSLRWWNTNAPVVTSYPGERVPAYYSTCFIDVARPQLSTISYYFARSPVLPPDPNGGYDEVLRLVDPRPGEPGFATAATTPLMIAPIGQPLFLTAWAKQAILNGFSNKFAYLEQYFTNACTIDATGNVTTNSAGLLSPYGEFFPMQPGPAALRTMADIDPPYQQGTGVVNIIKLQLDVNHDGVMDLSFGGPDNTSQVRPQLMWVNSDCDWATRTLFGNPSEVGHDISVLGGAVSPNYDYRDIAIRSQRDLEDYARLWICGVPSLPVNQGYQVTLSVANANATTFAVNLVNSVESDGGTGYLTDTNVAAAQVAYSDHTSPGYKFARLTTSQSYTFPDNYFTNNSTKHFLFEGAGVGSGQLVLTISQATAQGTNVIAQTGAWLDLHEIEDFYEQVYATNVPSSKPPSSLVSQYRVVHNGSGMGNETKQIIVYVHGMNRPDWDAQNEAETLFKRLYWSGYQGHFATFRWPCGYLPPNTWYPYIFNQSEFWAYKSSTALNNYLTDLRSRPELAGYAIDIVAHSQGTAVTCEALCQGAPFDNCILTQGAIPAHCLDTNAPFLQKLLDAETNSVNAKQTPFYPANGGYHGYYSDIQGNVVDFYNTNDFALATGVTYILGLIPATTNWEENQRGYKPEAFAGGPSYVYDPSTLTSTAYYLLGFGSYTVTDPQELRSMVARSRSKAVGAQGGLHGAIRSQVDLVGAFGFDRTRPEHSAEFVRPIQTVWGYYDQILRSFQIQLTVTR